MTGWRPAQDHHQPDPALVRRATRCTCWPCWPRSRWPVTRSGGRSKPASSAASRSGSPSRSSAHDLLLFPLYSLADLSVRRLLPWGAGRRRASRPAATAPGARRGPAGAELRADPRGVLAAAAAGLLPADPGLVRARVPPGQRADHAAVPVALAGGDRRPVRRVGGHLRAALSPGVIPGPKAGGPGPGTADGPDPRTAGGPHRPRRRPLSPAPTPSFDVWHPIRPAPDSPDPHGPA